MTVDDFNFLSNTYFDMREYYRGILPDNKFFQAYFQNCLDRGIDSDCILCYLHGLGWTIEYLIDCVGDDNA